VDHLGANLFGQIDKLVLWRAAANDEPGAALAQLGIEVGKALEQELCPGA
jgi:hypothetical protein